MEHRALWDLLAMMGHPVMMEYRESWDLKGSVDHLDHLEHRVSQDSQAFPAEPAIRESQEVVDLLAFQDQMEKTVNRVLMECLEVLDPPVYQDKRD